MNAQNLYDKLEIDFIARRGLSDDWKEIGTDKYLSPNFKKRSMGIVYDFNTEIKKVYTAVFPESAVLKKILSKKETDVLLFVHHPMVWDITKKSIFTSISEKDLKMMKKRRISVYNLHVPLDNFGKYSTTNTLCKELNIKVETQFAPYFGALCGVVGTIDLENISDIKKRFEKILGHKSMLYKYGTDKLNKYKVAVVAGGGNDLDILEKIPKDCNLFITGITAKNDYSKNAHDFSKKRKLNVLGGTHYSTEKFACIAMVEYFKKLGLPCEFIPGKPVMEDI
ncbi:MAG TPA: Nif3-like dinuclear metal center hexameric protein [archaeon]|jgi:putative NIF3 family GTP cyclohydrolase 1 type 2|nr:Nif3-like dinuclear metal center hexameric protein [archaeon]